MVDTQMVVFMFLALFRYGICHIIRVKLCTLKSEIKMLFVFSRGTNNKGVCNMIRTRPSVYSLPFMYLRQPVHIKLMKQVVKTIHRNVEKSLAFPSRWRIIDNKNINFYC